MCLVRGLVLDFGGVLTDSGSEELLIAVERARREDIRTAILSNADGRWAPPREWGHLFDAVVTSGASGVAKPDAEIYLLTASELGLEPGDCVFVDDLPVNVRGAAAAGMVGVHHTSVETTLQELEILLAIPLRG
ncbi:HAD-IA family hydrolase [Actinosynnema mirum]|uniref:HAD-superfamily hydrolase, subfamily IA, variant 3 n=1 Tax=Actinosynnema mirum (strain ATCC 29888 / DSM 43827 / JCM 3225 / NBRC 14064 / NCIMB 13271 / NRRL B-12336 / IMRU 3971 / 101) TaxID=446462 RepID=C6WJ31_ACTMD|nr:HAD-superfamily hydrolase, subfamily IA, variant 3 [Actinosynnema mirum DSM 43827]